MPRDSPRPALPALVFANVHTAPEGLAGRAYLRDSALPQRWRDQAIHTLLETGFGIGLNFLAAWACWRDDTHACQRLHYVALEPAAPDLATLRQALMQAGLDAPERALAQQLLVQWPMLLPGTHRLEFAAGRVVLTLVLGPLAKTLPVLALRADAFLLHAAALDAPDAARFVLRGLSRLAACGATLVADMPAAGLLEPLRECGFTVRTAAASASPDNASATASFDNACIAHFAPRYRVRRHEPAIPFAHSHPDAARDAIVIGAGLAGCALTHRLATRGWQLTLIEQSGGPAQQASGNPAGVFHPMITADDSYAARLSRAGFLYALPYWEQLRASCGAGAFQAHTDGLFVAAQSDSEFAAMRATLKRLCLPPSYVELLSREQAGVRTGVAPAYGGCLFPRGGWLDPRALCQAQLDAAGPALTRRFNCTVHSLERRDQRWHALDDSGATLASASAMIVANAGDAQRLLGLHHFPLSTIRGQLTELPYTASRILPLRLPVIGDGYLLRADDDTLMTGASYDPDDPDTALRADSQRDNLERLARLVPSSRARFDTAPLAGRVGFRCVAPDRMPMIGPLADEAALLASSSANAPGGSGGAHLADLPRQAGLYAAVGMGSRGLIWSALGAELIASQLDGEPWPIDRRLADGIDPARFLLRALRHGVTQTD